jgi:hypothetical protein
MKPKVRLAGLVLFAGFIAAQFFQPSRHKPSTDPTRSIWWNQRVDPRVGDILRRSCANCDSDETEWPWYSKISPVSWWVARHVENGREKLNLSDWSTASQDEIEEIYDSVAKKKMPLASFCLMHPEARLSKADQDLLLAWTDGKLSQESH